MTALKQSASEGVDTESGTASYDPSVEMDVDLTYNNDEQNGVYMYIDTCIIAVRLFITYSARCHLASTPALCGLESRLG